MNKEIQELITTGVGVGNMQVSVVSPGAIISEGAVVRGKACGVSIEIGKRKIIDDDDDEDYRGCRSFTLPHDKKDKIWQSWILFDANWWKGASNLMINVLRHSIFEFPFHINKEIMELDEENHVKSTSHKIDKTTGIMTVTVVLFRQNGERNKEHELRFRRVWQE